MKLSVIVPVYNVEHYLPACMDSVLPILGNGDELFLIQGQSTDQSSQLSYRYQEEYPQIRILNQNGQGLSNARNCGIYAASGDMILFVDSDDFIETAALQKLLEQLRSLEKLPDVVMTDFFRCYETMEKKQLVVQIGQRSLKGLDKLPSILKGHSCFWNVWRNLYRREFLIKHGLLFRENTYAEDVDYMTRVFLSNPELWMVDAPFYCYRIGRGGSLMNSISFSRVKQTVEILWESIQGLQINNTAWSLALANGFQFEYILNLALIQELPKEQRKEAIALFEDYRQVILPTHDLTVQKVAKFMQLFGVPFTAKILAAAKWMKRKRERRIP
ncbi:glycosyltransferase [Pseudoflavonifractor phocaeensis]|uniref:glycosyltransferase n=1 Tax=Pseudoflavonifractor phocaeensis TaxID=1870988 RepID=UPI00195E85BA|nr:glycosyltransferase [Pseudoflavonifractor phocaeensis]